MHTTKLVAAMAMLIASASAFSIPSTGTVSTAIRESPFIAAASNTNTMMALSTFRSNVQVYAANTEEEVSDTTSNNKHIKNIDILDEIDEIFDGIDTNGDGVITQDELRQHLVEEMGYTDEYTTYLFDSIDTDSSGDITKDEMKFAFYNFEALSMYMTFGMGGADITNRKAFKNLALKSSEEVRSKLLLDDLADLIFDIIDTDQSGEISKNELKAHFENVTSKLVKNTANTVTEAQTKEYIQTMFAILDVDKDGDICREEVRRAFQKYDFKLLARSFGLRVYQSTSD